MENNNYGDIGKKCYDDIIHLPHHVSPVHPQMPRKDRAAQFSPFAALAGYDEAIQETGRLTGRRMELEEDAKEILDEKLRMLQERLADQPEASITYFQPDGRKEGGSYITVAGRIKKIDNYGQAIVMQDGTRIPAGEIVGIEGKGEEGSVFGMPYRFGEMP